MTYVVFTHDELPAEHEAWPEHEHQREGHEPLKAQPVQGMFAVERPDGSIKKCTEGYGFLTYDPDTQELDLVPLSEFKQNYQGAEHVEL